jgi:hypothetical protein
MSQSYAMPRCIVRLTMIAVQKLDRLSYIPAIRLDH